MQFHPSPLLLERTRSTWRRETAAAETAAETARTHAPAGPITETDLEGLPAQIQRYLRFTGTVGRPRVAGFRARMTGAIRQGADSPWMPMEARQLSVLSPSIRLFWMRAARAGLPFHALHRFVGEHAHFRVRLLDLFTLVDAHGDWLDQSETVTIFNDLCLLAPAGLVGAPVTWQALDGDRVLGTYTRGAHRVSAVLAFGDRGELVDWESEDRYRGSSDQDRVLQRWSTPVQGYADFAGRTVARQAEARWTEPTGEFAYARFDLQELSYLS